MVDLTANQNWKESLSFSDTDNKIYIKANGHITASLCPVLRSKVMDRLNSSPILEEIYIELEHCIYMDSTFMGLLISFNKILKAKSNKSITLLHIAKECESLLKTIGILKLFTVSSENIRFPLVMENLVPDKSTSIDLLLDTHENLMEISDENKKRFANLHAVLKSKKPKNGKD